MKSVIFLLLFSVLAGGIRKSNNSGMVELCDNALDDDNDGMIDLNDPDCACELLAPVSLIPNPSFEEMTCCPQNRSELHCAETWIQASEPTTDYLHTCGWFGWDGLPVPLPLPDGNAVVGFRNGRFGNIVQPNWKEYAGACLLSSLKKGVEYRFEFYIGFTHLENSPPTNVVFYGSTDCDHLPFGVNDEEFGCPTNGPGWEVLGSVSVAGQNTWNKEQIVITPEKDYAAMAIGPDCVELDRTQHTYYFFDNLVLADSESFQFEIEAIHHPCAEGFSLELPEDDSIKYQWYHEGIALVGETFPRLTNIPGPGKYQAKIDNGIECKVTSAYNHVIPEISNIIQKRICVGESISFAGQSLNSPGIYQGNFKTRDNCDSVVTINLDIVSHNVDSVRLKLFAGETLKLGKYRIKEEGSKDLVFESSLGCDSLVHATISFYQVYFPNIFSPNGDGVNDYFCIGVTPDILEISSMKIFDRWGNMVWSNKGIGFDDCSMSWNGQQDGQDLPTGVYTYISILLMDDHRERTKWGSITLVR